ncbi:hypothetical protein FDW83_12125 [Pseudarthrobacter sp. NamE2]|uniref:hypothetical protein n=1 Tax=Pseudarthrobacter sp. NamE2 TaxID=2576838 RepID=UPI0010FCE2F3|nr:hypothetical protein [Pseudarthrobacter sp. NamE2]TLM82692.1 hypothetical protein FDW83_12125 [Pseudarthrobacter sp. NamE2]
MIQQRPAHRPWTFAAVCVMVTSLTLLVFGLTQVPVIELAPGYVATYMLIGVCIFGPTGKLPSLRQAMSFLLPGALFVVLALLNLGFWCGGWLLGLPAWGLMLNRWTSANALRAVDVLKFLGLLVLGIAVFTLNSIWVIFSLGLFLLPVIVLVRLAYPEYRARLLQAAVEVVLALAAVLVAFAIPTPEGSWSPPWMYAGGAATAGLMITYWAWKSPRHFRRSQHNNGAIV